MGIREYAGREARRRRYWKRYDPQAVLAHFVAQQSKYSQRLLASAGERKAAVAWEKGRTVDSLKGTPFLLRNRLKILDRLADALVDHMRLGVTHGDIFAGNIIVSGGRGRRGPVRIRLIDYEEAHPLASGKLGYSEKVQRILDRHMRERIGRGDVDRALAGKYAEESVHWGDDYPRVLKGVIPALAKDENDKKGLERYFERKFLERVRKKL